MKLRLSARAARDLGEIAAYLDARDPRAARRVEERLAAALRTLVEHPSVGRDVGRGLRRYAVPRLPYLIVYRVDASAGAVAGVTVRHAARRPVV